MMRKKQWSGKHPIGVGSWIFHEEVCMYVYVWPVQMDWGPIWTEWGHNRNQSIKATSAESRNLALSSSTYPGVSYKLNPAVRMGSWKEMSWGSWPWKRKSNVAGHGSESHKVRYIAATSSDARWLENLSRRLMKVSEDPRSISAPSARAADWY